MCGDRLAAGLHDAQSHTQSTRLDALRILAASRLQKVADLLDLLGPAWGGFVGSWSVRRRVADMPPPSGACSLQSAARTGPHVAVGHSAAGTEGRRHTFRRDSGESHGVRTSNVRSTCPLRTTEFLRSSRRREQACSQRHAMAVRLPNISAACHDLLLDEFVAYMVNAGPEPRVWRQPGAARSGTQTLSSPTATVVAQSRRRPARP